MRWFPTMTAVEHVGINVPDLDEAVTFFTEVLGAAVVWRMGELHDEPDGAPAARLGVPSGTSVRLALLRFGSNVAVELLEFVRPDPPPDPGAADPGVAHLGFHVDDLAAAAAYLRNQPGVRVLTEAEDVEGAPYVFAITPWGLRLELNPQHVPQKEG